MALMFVCPLVAQALLVAGAPFAIEGDGLLIDGRRLIGQAGRLYSFKSAASADKWAAAVKGRGQGEAARLAAMTPAAAQAFRARREELLTARIVRMLVNAAASDADKAAAMREEAEYCTVKWAAP